MGGRGARTDIAGSGDRRAADADATSSPPSESGHGGEDRDGQFQRQARALGEATRYRIFRYVVDADGPVGVAAITAHVGLNHNSVRQHLAKLCAAGLLVEEVARSGGPGRPTLRYRAAAAAGALSGASSPYEHLSLLLLEVLGGGDPVEVGAAAGRRALSPVKGDVDPLDVLEARMTQQGFHSRREQTGTAVELVVSSCPFEAAAAANAEIVCELHRGMAQGMVEALGSDVVHVGLDPGNPRADGCRIRLERAVDAGRGPS